MWRWRPVLIFVALGAVVAVATWWWWRSVEQTFDPDAQIVLTDGPDPRATLPTTPEEADIPPETRRAIQTARDAFLRGDSTPGIDPGRYVVTVGFFEGRPQDVRLRDRSTLLECVAAVRLPPPAPGTEVVCGRRGMRAWDEALVQDYVTTAWEPGLVALLRLGPSREGVDTVIDPQLDPRSIPPLTPP